MNASLFVDTSGWLAYFVERDQYHAQAVRVWRQLAETRVRLVTSDYVLDELLTLLARRVGPPAAVTAGQVLLTSALVHVVYVAPEYFLESWELFKRSDYPQASFTDTASFVIMRRLSLREVFGFDTDFRQAGFALLPHHA